MVSNPSRLAICKKKKTWRGSEPTKFYTNKCINFDKKKHDMARAQRVNTSDSQLLTIVIGVVAVPEILIINIFLKWLVSSET